MGVLELTVLERKEVGSVGGARDGLDNDGESGCGVVCSAELSGRICKMDLTERV